MTNDGLNKIFFMIEGYGFSDFKPKSKDTMLAIWGEVLKEYSDNQIISALMEYLRNEGHFAPKPSDLIKILESVKQYADVTESEANALVMKALRNSTYNSEKEFEKLPSVVQKAVGSASQLRMWATDDNFNQEVVESHIRRSYRNALAQEQQYRQMHPKFKELADAYADTKPAIDSVSTNTMMLPEKEEKTVTDSNKDYISMVRGKLNETR